jgi:hypothetical protein
MTEQTSQPTPSLTDIVSQISDLVNQAEPLAAQAMQLNNNLKGAAQSPFLAMVRAQLGAAQTMLGNHDKHVAKAAAAAPTPTASPAETAPAN